MLQSVATLISVLIAAGMVAVIAAVLADDWLAVMRALGVQASLPNMALPTVRTPTGDRRARVVRVSSQSVRVRVAA